MRKFDFRIREKLKGTLFRDTFIYTITDVIGKGMSFVLLPIVSFYITPDELGIATNFTVVTSFVSLIAGLAIVNSLPYFFYEQNKKENTLMVSNLLILCVLACLGLAVLITSINRLITHYLHLSLSVLLLCVVYVVGMLITQASLILMRLENKPHQFACYQVFQIVFHAFAVVLFVMILRGGGLGKIYAETIVFFVIGFLHLIVLIRKGYIKLHWSNYWIRKLLSFGLPLLPHSVSFWMKNGVDKVFITTFYGLQFNGLYSMAISISAIYTMLVQSFFNAYTPYLQKRIVAMEGEVDCEKEKQNIVKQTYQLFGLFGLVGILAVAASWGIFVFLLDKSYLPAYNYMPPIILASYIYTFYNFTIQYIYKKKKTLIMGVITLTGSILQMLLAYVMIKKIGVMGAAYSLLIGNIIITIGISYYSSKVYRMPWIATLRSSIPYLSK